MVRFIFILEFLLEENLLWERTNNSIPIIKQFCTNLITDKILQKNKENNFQLEKGITSLTLDFLECILFYLCLVISEYMTRKIVEEIKIYDKIKPFKQIYDGIFGSGCGLKDEHLINIDLNISNSNVTYTDSFEWDIINENNM